MAYVKKKTESKQETAYQFIKEAIINNDFLPNAMLVEGSLCEQLGFSKTPIREALRRLTSEGLVEFIPERGCCVSDLSIREFVNIFDVREAIEGMAARLCATYRDAWVAEELKNRQAEMEGYTAVNDFAKVLEADSKQHEAVIDGSNNHRIRSIFDVMNAQILRVRLITSEDNERLTMSCAEHEKMVRAIVDGDPERAEAEWRAHIRSIKDFVIGRKYMVGGELLRSVRSDRG